MKRREVSDKRNPITQSFQWPFGRNIRKKQQGRGTHSGISIDGQNSTNLCTFRNVVLVDKNVKKQNKTKTTKAG